MVYKILKVWAFLCFRFYFRRIYVTGRQNVPSRGSVLFIVNHPSSFMEACLLACFQHRELHFLVRGDVFEKPWLRKFLELTNQIPIYRFKDGFSKLKNNKSTFSHSFKVLSEQKALLIFPEASTLMVKYLRPLQKGAARLAIGSLEEGHCDELLVIPTGVYYEQAVKSRSDVVIKMGEPISMRKWMDANQSGEDKLSQLTTEFQTRMEEVMISLKNPEKEKLFNDVFNLVEPHYFDFKESGYWKTEVGFNSMRKFESDFDALSTEQFNKIDKYVDHLKRFRFTFKSISANYNSGKFRKLILMIKSVFYFFMSLPGLLLYSPALFFPNYFVKSKIKHIEFHSPIRIALFMILHILISALLFIVLGLNYGLMYSGIILILLQCSLYFFCQFTDVTRYSRLFFRKIEKNKERELHSNYTQILNELGLR